MLICCHVELKRNHSFWKHALAQSVVQTSTFTLHVHKCTYSKSSTETMKYTFWNMDSPEKKSFRNADTVEVHDENLAAAIWQRMQAHVQTIITIDKTEDRWERGLEGSWQAVGINPHFLFVRYGPGNHFSPHTGNTSTNCLCQSLPCSSPTLTVSLF